MGYSKIYLMQTKKDTGKIIVMLACVPWEYALPNKSWIELKPVKTQKVWNMKKRTTLNTILVG